MLGGARNWGWTRPIDPMKPVMTISLAFNYLPLSDLYPFFFVFFGKFKGWPWHSNTFLSLSSVTIDHSTIYLFKVLNTGTRSVRPPQSSRFNLSFVPLLAPAPPSLRRSRMTKHPGPCSLEHSVNHGVNPAPSFLELSAGHSTHISWHPLSHGVTLS